MTLPGMQSEARLVTAILPKGKAISLMETLYEKGFTRISFNFARGHDALEAAGKSDSFIEDREKDILTIITDNETEGDRAMALLFHEGDMNRPGGGLVSMSRLRAATPFQLPEVDQKEA